MADPEPLVVPWRELHGQFGSNYSRVSDFAANARKQFKTIDELRPELDYETPRGRLKVRNRTPPFRVQTGEMVYTRSGTWCTGQRGGWSSSIVRTC